MKEEVRIAEINQAQIQKRLKTLQKEVKDNERQIEIAYKVVQYLQHQIDSTAMRKQNYQLYIEYTDNHIGHIQKQDKLSPAEKAKLIKVQEDSKLSYTLQQQMLQKYSTQLMDGSEDKGDRVELNADEQALLDQYKVRAALLMTSPANTQRQLGNKDDLSKQLV